VLHRRAWSTGAGQRRGKGGWRRFLEARRRPRHGAAEGRGKEGGEKKKEKREKEKEKKEKEKEREQEIGKKENKGEKKIEKGFRKLGEISRKIRREVKKGFCGFFWVSQIPALIPGRR
jgi:hypothetical protein